MIAIEFSMTIITILFNRSFPYHAYALEGMWQNVTSRKRFRNYCDLNMCHGKHVIPHVGHFNRKVFFLETFGMRKGSFNTKCSKKSEFDIVLQNRMMMNIRYLCELDVYFDWERRLISYCFIYFQEFFMKEYVPVEEKVIWYVLKFSRDTIVA